MTTEKDQVAITSEAKQEWERILEEALHRADGMPFQSKAEEKREAVDSTARDDAQSIADNWDLEVLLGRQWMPDERGSDPEPPVRAEPDLITRRENKEGATPQTVQERRSRTQTAVADRPTGERRRPSGASASHNSRTNTSARQSGTASSNRERRSADSRPRTTGGKRKKLTPIQKFRKNTFWLLAFLWFALVFSELLVRAVTSDGTFWEAGWFLSLLFAIFPAILIFVVSTISKKPKVNKWIVCIILFVVYMLYASQLVYYQVFGQFYTAVSMGNAGQGFGFMTTILVTIGKNIIALIFLAFPMLFAILFGRRFFSFKGGAGLKSSVALTVVGIVLHFFVVLILPLWGTDTMTPYDFYHYTYDVKDSAVQLGLGTAFRLDVKWAIFGTGKTHGLDLGDEDWDEPKPSDSTGTSDATGTSGSTDPDATGDTTQTAPTEYGYNVLESLDLEALAAAEGDSDIRDMHLYFDSIEPTKKNEKTGMFEGCNLILITAESFSHMAIDPELTPTLYKMQNEGFNFTNFYTPIWGVSTSDGEYVAMTGTIPKPGVWSFYRTGEQKNNMSLTMCGQLKKLGYSAYGYHNHDYAYYDRELSHPNMGYIWEGIGNGLEYSGDPNNLDGVNSSNWPESDIELIQFTTEDYIHQEPFHAYYMTVSGHKEYNFLGGNDMSTKNKSLVSHLPYSDTVKAYLATQIELDRAMALLLQRLEEAGVAENTVIVISADHYPYGLTPEEISELEGHEIDTTFEMYRNALIIYKPGMEPETVDELCCSMDILPTLSNLFGLDFDSRLYIGHDIFSDAEPLVIFQNRDWMTDKACYKYREGEVISLTGEEISEDYIKRINRMVKNKFSASASILDMDYWGILFDVQ